MNHEKTFEAINKLKEIEIELHRLKNALEMTNRALETKDEQSGSSAITNPEFVAEQKEKTQQLRNMVDVQNMASKSTYKEQLEKKDEPVALVAEVHISRYTIEWTNGPLPQGTKLYTTTQRKPLTDEHIDEIPFALFEQDQNGISATEALREFARAIEAAHGIKE